MRMRKVSLYAWTRSIRLLARAKVAAMAGDRAHAAFLKYRSAVWLERHLLLAGLSSWRQYRAGVRQAKSERRGDCSGPPHRLLGSHGAEREGRAWPLRGPFLPLGSLPGGRP